MRRCYREYGPTYYETETPEVTFQRKIHGIDFLLEVLAGAYKRQSGGFCSVANGDLGDAMERLEEYRDKLVSELSVWKQMEEDGSAARAGGRWDGG